MILNALLTQLHARDVRLDLVDGKLKINAPPGALTEDLLGQLRKHKSRLLELLAASSETTDPAISVIERSDLMHCSPAQQRLWLADRIVGGSAAYNLPSALRMEGALDVEALAQVLRHIVRRHEALRTQFVDCDGEPMQHIVPSDAADNWAALSIEVADASSIAQQFEQHAATIFKLDTGPLVSFKLLRISAEEHVLMLNFHHIVTDGWSMGVLVKELCELYQARVQGRDTELPGLTLQYPDYAHWQRQLLQHGAMARQLAYWKQRLTDVPDLLPLPSDHCRPAAQSQRGATADFEVSASVWGRLTALAHAESASLFMTVLAAFQWYLSRLSGERDIVVGSPIANRDAPELEPLVGFFVNTLVLRCRLDNAESFRHLLGRVRNQTLQDFAHQALPFEYLVEALQPARSLSYSPLFQVAFSMHSGTDDLVRLGNLTVQPLTRAGRHSKFDLTLSIQESVNGVSGSFEYATDLFERPRVQRWTNEFLAVLQAVSLRPDTPLSALAQSEKNLLQQRLAPSIGEQRPLSDYSCVPDVIANHARTNPNDLALVGAGKRLSYSEFDQAATRLAIRLRHLGVAPEQRVGICIPRGPSALIAMLATWKVGAAWVPLDPSYPLDRLRHICADADVQIVCAASSTSSLCERLGCASFDVDNVSADLKTGASEDAVPLHAKQLAYVIYTSGSTGTPKGVMVGHQALLSLVDWYALQTQIGSLDRASQIAQLGFDASIWEVWGALAAGASLHFVDNETRLNPQLLIDWLRDQAITLAFMPTPLVEEVLSSAIPLPARLRWLCCGGEQLKHHAPAHGSTSLLNAYGPTEAAVVSLAGVVVSEISMPITIGRPLPNTCAYILDPALQPVALGEPGELFLAGINLGRGYHRQPQLTAERFLPDPFAACAGSRMYRTGDRVRCLDSGEFEFIGRLDNQVKLRGYRIELGEVECALAQQPGVSDAVVTLVKGPVGSDCLVGYVSAAIGHVLDENQLFQGLKAKLPSFMVPTHVQVLSAFPLGPSGKVDRTALPAPQWRRNDQLLDPPTSDMEQELSLVWQDLLGLETIGIHEDFFALGGHSLLATRLLARIKGQFDLELPLAEVFNAPTISGLADVIAARTNNPPPSLGKIESVSRAQALPLSFAQQRLWFLAQLDPGSNAYNMPVVMRMSGELNISAMAQAVAALVERHEVLRARFVESDGEPAQQFDLRPEPMLTQRVGEHELMAALDQFLKRSFDLEHDPVLRSVLFQISEQEHVLALVVHHIAADGWSMNIIGRDLSELYVAAMKGSEVALPSPSIQYGDYAHWQRNHLDEAVLAGELDYWTKQLAGVPEMLELPRDHPRDHHVSLASAIECLDIEPELLAQVRMLGQRHGATVFMTLLATFNVLLFRLSGQDDICVGTPMVNRQRPELEPLVGLFLGTLALRTRLCDSPNFEQCLERVRSITLAAFSHQNLPFERIVDALQLQRDLSRHPLFQVFFNMINEERGAEPVLPGLVVSSVLPPDQGSKFDLTLYAHEVGDRIALQLHYNAALFAAPRMAEMLRQFHALLRQVVSDPTLAINRYCLRSETARQYLPDPEAPLASDWRGGITRHFSRHCQNRGLHPALSDESGTVSYAELDLASNRVANFLVSNGVGVGKVVALHSRRCPAIATALLGVLKTGAAFMLLDAAYPIGRLLDCITSVEPAAWLDVGLEAPPELLLELDALECPRAFLSSATDGLDDASDDAPTEPSFSPDSFSHIAFTSGSTGRPKAIAGRHSAFTQFLPWFESQLGIGADDRFSVLSGLSHDPLQRDVLWPLMLGGTACFPDPECVMPGALANWFQEQKISVTNLTPAMSQVLTDADTDVSLPELRCACVVGDVLPGMSVKRILALAPQCQVVSFYGATETQWALAYEVANGCGQDSAVDLGRGIPGVQLVLLNTVGVPAGVGELAEICIRSPHLASGYWQDDSLTKAKFVSSPWGNGMQDRLYRTGDLGRYLPDGRVRGAGRMDRQVSVRGFRVELGEIEAVLLQNAAIAACVVVAIPLDDSLGAHSRLVAHVVQRLPATLAWMELETALREAVRNRLPEYMHPSRWVRLERIPLTSNGKIDVAELHALSQCNEPHPDDLALPIGTHEEKIAGVFADVLGLSQVGRSQQFFELGGNSLLAMQVASRLRKQLATLVTVRQVFENPTVSALAAVLGKNPPGFDQDAVSTDNHDLLAFIRDNPRVSRIPLSFAQQRLWFLQQLEGESDRYNMQFAVQMRGPLDLSSLQRALTGILARHESLRTVFVEHEGTAEQRVLADNTELPLSVLAIRPESLIESMNDFTGQVFALDRQLPIRAALFVLDVDVHVLAVCMHHIVSDGWSMGVFFAELAEIYSAGVQGRAMQLATLSLQYPDYARWQRAELQQLVMERQRAFWLETLQDAPRLLELPTDFARPPFQSLLGDKVPVRIEGLLFDQLRQLSRTEGVTSFMLLMAAWQILLARLAGQTDLSVGFPMANRSSPELEPMIGLFTNTLVLRTQPKATLSFREYLGQVRERTLAAYANQDMPFEAVVDLLQVPRSLAHTPVFQVMLNLQNLGVSDIPMAGLSIEAVPRGREAARFDMTLVLCESEMSWVGDLEYCSDLWHRDTIEQYAKRFLVLLAGIVRDPASNLARLPWLTPDEQHRLIGKPSVRQAQLLPWQAVHQRFEHWAKVQPDATALVSNGRPLSYSELNISANRLARWLRVRGIGREQCVGVLLPRGEGHALTMLACAKAGAAYLPIDINNPGERLQQIVNDASVALLLVDSALEISLPDGVAVCFLQDVLADSSCGKCGADNLLLPVDPGQLAYAIYTSGTTGTPKAAALTHYGWSNLAGAQGALHSVLPGSRVLQVVSSAFDVAAGDFALALTHGATLVVASDAARRDPGLLLEIIQRERISHAQIPVALLAQIPCRDELPDLRVLVAGGEVMPDSVLDTWGNSVALFNAYGPTETTVMASCARLTPGMSVNIGNAIPGNRLYVLDCNLQPVPPGVFGEIWISGAGVGRGYLRRPALTAAAFIPDPFATQPGQRMYRSGDNGRWCRDGVLHIRGRTDSQIKLRGYRIELGEIESVIASWPSVTEVAVLLREDVPGQRQLVAYVVAGLASRESLNEQARRSLLEYMRPMAWVQLPRLPMTANGKVDRKALPAPLLESTGANAQVEGNAIEQAIAAVYSRLLGRRPVGVHDNFFEIGGDSILSIQAIALLAEAGWKVTTRQMYENSTVRELALVAVPRSSQGKSDAPVMGEVGLTPIQSWFFEVVSHAPQHWNQSLLLDVSETLDVSKVELAVHALQIHHDALRLRVGRKDIGWHQEIAPPENCVPLQRIEIESESLDGFARSLCELATRVQSEFSFDATPLFRALWVESRDGRLRRLWLLAHHLLVDAVSWRIILEDMQRLLMAPTSQPSALPDKTTSYQLWSTRLREHSVSARVMDEKRYWLDTLQLPMPVLPGLSDDDDVDGDAIKVTAELDQEQTRWLLQTCNQAYDTRINDLLLTALALAFRSWTGAKALRVALEGHGRDAGLEDVDLSRTVGWFTVNHPLALRLPESDEIGDCIVAVRDQLAAVPEAGLGYGMLRYLARDSDIQCAAESAGEASISFNYLGQIGPALERNGPLSISADSTGPNRNPRQRRPHLIDVVGAVDDVGLQMDFRYGKSRISSGSVHDFASEFRHALVAIIAHCRINSGIEPDEGRYLHANAGERLNQARAADLALITLRAEGRRRPLFCVHPAGGSIDCYRELALALGSDQPIYGLQSPSLTGEVPAMCSFEAMAAVYLQALKRVQPIGPYRILGWSQGGSIAYEMARQLQDRGERVERLLLVDSGQAKSMLQRNLRQHTYEDLIEHLQQSGFVADLGSLLQLPLTDRFDAVVDQARQQQLLPDGIGGDLLHAILETQRGIATATAAYLPGGYAGPAVLLRAQDEHLFGHLGLYLGWATDACGAWRIVNVPGDHFGCIRAPNVNTLADRLQPLLDDRCVEEENSDQDRSGTSAAKILV